MGRFGYDSDYCITMGFIGDVGRGFKHLAKETFEEKKQEVKDYFDDRKQNAKKTTDNIRLEIAKWDELTNYNFYLNYREWTKWYNYNKDNYNKIRKWKTLWDYDIDQETQPLINRFRET